MVYDYVITKPPLDEVIAHWGVKGMRWGHRRRKELRKKYKISRMRANKVAKIEYKLNKDKKNRQDYINRSNLKKSEISSNLAVRDYDDSIRELEKKRKQLMSGVKER